MDVDDEPILGLGADGRPDPDTPGGSAWCRRPALGAAAAFALDALVWIVLALPGRSGSP
jgi:hypothetical protein